MPLLHVFGPNNGFPVPGAGCLEMVQLPGSERPARHEGGEDQHGRESNTAGPSQELKGIDRIECRVQKAPGRVPFVRLKIIHETISLDVAGIC